MDVYFNIEHLKDNLLSLPYGNVCEFNTLTLNAALNDMIDGYIQLTIMMYIWQYSYWVLSIVKRPHTELHSNYWHVLGLINIINTVSSFMDFFLDQIRQTISLVINLSWYTEFTIQALKV